MESATVKAGDLIAERFHVLNCIGRGGYGEVFRAEQVSTGREVALKLLSTGSANDSLVIERFRLEARRTCQLHHPNTVICHDFGEDRERGVLFLAMEYLDGETLAELLEKRISLSTSESLQILEGIAGSLGEAHEKGLIHRDLKPANIMLISRDTSDSFVKVIDFGIAKIFDDGDKSRQPRLTKAGMVMGSPHYMAPEQIRREPLDHRVDIYAAGVLVFEMLTGLRPFPGTHYVNVMHMHISSPPPAIHLIAPRLNIPSILTPIINKALAKNPSDRYDSIYDFLNAFRTALQPTQEVILRPTLSVIKPPPSKAPSSLRDFVKEISKRIPEGEDSTQQLSSQEILSLHMLSAKTSDELEPVALASELMTLDYEDKNDADHTDIMNSHDINRMMAEQKKLDEHELETFDVSIDDDDLLLFAEEETLSVPYEALKEEGAKESRISRISRISKIMRLSKTQKNTAKNIAGNAADNAESDPSQTSKDAANSPKTSPLLLFGILVILLLLITGAVIFAVKN